LSLNVKVNGVVATSYYPDQGISDLDLINNTTLQTCGANLYFFSNNTIHFIVTNDVNCFVEVYQVNSVQINLRVQTT